MNKRTSARPLDMRSSLPREHNWLYTEPLVCLPQPLWTKRGRHIVSPVVGQFCHPLPCSILDFVSVDETRLPTQKSAAYFFAVPELSKVKRAASVHVDFRGKEALKVSVKIHAAVCHHDKAEVVGKQSPLPHRVGKPVYKRPYRFVGKLSLQVLHTPKLVGYSVLRSPLLDTASPFMVLLRKLRTDPYLIDFQRLNHFPLLTLSSRLSGFPLPPSTHEPVPPCQIALCGSWLLQSS